ncbi:MAG: hypothetical protein ACTS4T_01520 [Candidatus Hodgkinia cicadicola]
MASDRQQSSVVTSLHFSHKRSLYVNHSFVTNSPAQASHYFRLKSTKATSQHPPSLNMLLTSTRLKFIVITVEPTGETSN